MKNFPAAALLLLLLIPMVVFADPPAGGIGVGGGTGNVGPAVTGTVNPPPIDTPPDDTSFGATITTGSGPQSDAEVGPGETVVNGEVQSTASTASEIAAQVNQCGQPSTGSAFQQALSGIGSRLGRAALQGVANGLSSYGIFGRAAGSILTGSSVGDVGRGLIGTAGSYAGNAVSQEIAGACGDSSLGRQICGTVGSAVGNYVQGAINQYGGQILNNIGAGSVGQIFGGSGLGGAVGSVVGGVAGGGQVPVACQGCEQAVQHASESADRIASHTDALTENVLQNAQFLVYSTCEAEPTVAALNARAIAAAQGRVLTAAAQQQNQNPQNSEALAGQTAVEWFLTNPESGLTQEQRAAGTRWVSSGMPDCNSAPQSRNSIQQLWLQASYDEFCSDTALQARINAERLRGIRSYHSLTDTTVGPNPTGTCDAGPYTGVVNQPTLCPPGHYRVGLTSSDITALQQRAEGHQFDLSLASIGTAADRLGAQLIDEIFTTVGNAAQSGLQRLISNRSSGSSRNGSFVDRLSGNVGPTEQQAAQYLTTNVTDALSIEAQYQEATQAILDSLISTQTVFRNIQACYATLAAHPAGSITASTAQTATDNASTTVNVVLGRQITARQQNIDASQSAVNDLGVLLDQIQAAAGANQINNTADTYNAMIAAGRIHTTEELQLLADDVNQLVPALALAKQDAEIQLTQCQAYGSAPAPSGG